MFLGHTLQEVASKMHIVVDTMHCYFVVELRSIGPHTPDEERVFQEADTTFDGAIISMLGDTIVDAYMTPSTGKKCGMHSGQIWSF